MNTGPPPISSGTPLVGLVPRWNDAARQKATPLPRRRPIDDDWGQSESLDPDNVGDIADEGAGHRG